MRHAYDKPSTQQAETCTSEFEQDVLDIANNPDNNLAQLDANGHSQFYNLFNDTIDFYGDRQNATWEGAR